MNLENNHFSTIMIKTDSADKVMMHGNQLYDKNEQKTRQNNVYIIQRDCQGKNEREICKKEKIILPHMKQ